jgi:HAD superfamily hydrolase (TIGR01509 family)
MPDQLRQLPAPMSLELIIFDCDGVLVDSETVAGRVAAASLADLGWHITPEECQQRFTGMSLRDLIPIVEARVGKLPPTWLAGLACRMLHAMQRDLKPMPGALETLLATDALELPWRIASNSSRMEMAAKLAVTGIAALVGDRYHAVSDVPRPKPAPDLFQAAATAQGAVPEACLVIEDSPTGIRAARAAGMSCIGFAPRNDGTILRALGAPVVYALTDLPPLFARARDFGLARLMKELP